ncbi:MAG TPA: hypothetical protein G4O03_04295 [Dehalococcoidia bacterium]|nr:hypothetical protein [Dehalococcoidia bacterium]
MNPDFVIEKLKPHFDVLRSAIVETLRGCKEIGYVIKQDWCLDGPYYGTLRRVRLPTEGALGDFHTHFPTSDTWSPRDASLSTRDIEQVISNRLAIAAIGYLGPSHDLRLRCFTTDFRGAVFKEMLEELREIGRMEEEYDRKLARFRPALIEWEREWDRRLKGTKLSNPRPIRELLQKGRILRRAYDMDSADRLKAELKRRKAKMHRRITAYFADIFDSDEIVLSDSCNVEVRTPPPRRPRPPSLHNLFSR